MSIELTSQGEKMLFHPATIHPPYEAFFLGELLVLFTLGGTSLVMSRLQKWAKALLLPVTLLVQVAMILLGQIVAFGTFWGVSIG